MEEWSKGFPVDYSPGGDTTATAIKAACVDEVTKIYSHLNALKNATDENVALDTVDTVRGETHWLPTYRGTGADVMLEGLPLANESNGDVYGVTKLGSADRVIKKLEDETNPADYGAITETEFLKATNALGVGAPAGVIIMWYGNIAELPRGWVLCDGANRTPNLVNKFVRGGSGEVFAEGGTEAVTVEQSYLLEHTHSISHSLMGNAHNHSVAGNANLAVGTHTHQGTVNGGVDYASVNHNHTTTALKLLFDLGASPTGPGSQSYISSPNNTTATAGAGGNHTHPAVSGSVSVAAHNESHAHDIAGTTSADGAVDITLEGSTKATSKEGSVEYKIHPAYMALVYLMKL